MQVFKLFMKLLRANIRPFIIYISIFIGLLFGIIIPKNTKEAARNFAERKCNFAVIDEDATEASAALKAFLTANHTEISLKNENMETIQDQLFYREADAVVILKEGFQNALWKNGAEEYVNIYTIPGTFKARLFEQDLNSYIGKLTAYRRAGFSVSEAVAKADETAGLELKATMAEGVKAADHSSAYYFFIFLSWIFLAACIQAVSPVLGIMDKKEVRNRVSVSAYTLSSFLKETVLATMVVGVGICVLFILVAAVTLPDSILTIKGGLWMVNMLCFMVVTMGFTLLASKITTNSQVISAISNIVSLGMAFTCGVFVPMEFLGEGVIKFAHFLPAYWYVQAVDLISTDAVKNIQSILVCLGIELLFGAALIAIAMVVSGRKQMN
ncbi:MAG: ABC transporter permease [Clostridiales bacterium]|nr:ABC transporter permease [Candidatus Blautia equi]